MKRSSVLVAAATLLAGALTTQSAESVAAPAPAPRFDARAVAPSNDAFAARTPLTVGSVVPADVVGATSETGEPDLSALRATGCASVTDASYCGATAWYSFTAPSSASYVIDTCDSPGGLDTYLEVFTGTSINALSLVDSNDDSPGTGSRPCGASSSLTLAAVAGTTYPVRLSGYGASEGTTYLGVFADGAVPAAPAANALVTIAPVADPLTFGGATPSGGRRTASFTFTTTPVGTPTECALDGAVFASCTSPVSYPVADGPGVRHAFRVRAAGDPTPTIMSFSIDRTAPDTTFAVSPAEGSTVTLPAYVLPVAVDPFEGRGASNPGTCVIDTVSVLPCGISPGSPLVVSTDLCAGSHTVLGQAFDHAGNLDPTPATRTFTTTANAACGSAQPTLTGATVMPINGSTYLSATATVSTASRYGELLLELGPEAGQYVDGGRVVVPPSAGTQTPVVTARAAPGSTYHYRLTVRTATGSSTSGDQVVTVPPVAAGTAVQDVNPGKPVMAGPNALSIPVTVTVGAPARAVVVKAFVSATPVVVQEGFARSADEVVSASSTGPTTVQIPLVDVEPGQVIHYRIISVNSTTTPVPAGTRYTIGPDLTFTVPVPPAPPVPPVVVPPVVVPPVVGPPYKLAVGQVAVKKLKRTAGKIKVTVAGLPARAQVAVAVKGKKLKAALPAATVPAAGSRTFVVKLTTKARAALRAKALRKVKVTVSVTPADGTAQEVTLTVPVT